MNDNDTPEDQIPSTLADTLQPPSPIVIFPRMSHRMIAEALKMFRQDFSYPPARKRKPSHELERRARAKQRKKSVSP
jgi:hypothetical protein